MVKVKLDQNVLRKTIDDVVDKSTFDITCPNCQTTFSVKGSQFGSNITCPNCQIDIYLNDEKLKKDINKIKG